MARSVMRDVRLRRTMLMTPGNRPERLRKMSQYRADAMIFDLEDSVPPSEKKQARLCVAQALQDFPADGRERCVRINSIGSGFGLDDLNALPLGLIDSIMVPKVESAFEILQVEQALLTLGCDLDRDIGLELIVILETPRGMLNALSIADATSRTTALFFGSGDYSSATGATVCEMTLHYPRSVITAVAAACGQQAIDAAYFLQVKDVDLTREDAIVARQFGFSGKVVFHPNQIEVVNEVFSPSQAEIEHASKLVAAYQSSILSGHGTSLVDGVFVAVDLVAPAERLLILAEKLRVQKQ